MTYAIAVPFTGIAGWRFLQRTQEQQVTALGQSASIAREADYFREKIPEIGKAEDLVADRRLLSVALGAFGLQDDIDGKAFIQKILEGGTIEPDALANKLSDDRYRALSSAFGFGDFDVPSTQISDFGERIASQYVSRQFEVSVGETDNNLRLALNAERQLSEMAGKSSSDTTKWLRVLGTPPLRKVFETAFRLPASFAQLDLDRQVEVIRDRSADLVGTDQFSGFSDADTREKLLERFLVQAQIAEIQSASVGSSALTLMQSAADFARRLSA